MYILLNGLPVRTNSTPTLYNFSVLCAFEGFHATKHQWDREDMQKAHSKHLGGET